MAARTSKGRQAPRKAQPAAKPRSAPASKPRPARAEKSRASKVSSSSLGVRFWGVRGSLATPGERTLRVGGNTSCVEIRAGGELLVFDLGSGLRGLGRSLMQQGPVSGHLFVSHYHWDHIVGLPFFSPAYDPRSQLTVHGPTRKGRDVRQVLSGQMIDPYFPVELSIFRAQMDYRPIEEEQEIKIGRATVRTFGLNHPGGSVGYRVDAGGHAVVYATDFEHGSRADDRLVEIATGADLLIFDSQYLPAEYDAPAPFSRKGWGHSTYEAGAALAQRARVKQLALYHHEPERDDEAIGEIAARARELHPGAFAACEGLAIEF